MDVLEKKKMRAEAKEKWTRRAAISIGETKKWRRRRGAERAEEMRENKAEGEGEDERRQGDNQTQM